MQVAKINLPPGSPEEALSDWRKQAINVTILVISLAGFPLTAINIINLYTRPDKWLSLAGYTLPYLLAILLLFVKTPSYRWKGNILMFAIYTTGLVDLLCKGLLSSGREYLLALPILAVILTDINTGIFLSFLSMATLLATGYLDSQSLLFNSALLQSGPISNQIWIDSVSTQALISGCMVLVISLFHRFQLKNLNAQFQGVSDLKQSNEQLLKEISEHQAADLRAQFQVQRLNALREIDKAISANVDLQTILTIVCQQIIIHLEADAAEISLTDNQEQLELNAFDGLRLKPESRAAINADPSLARLALHRQITIQFNDPTHARGLNEAVFTNDQKVQSYFAIPLIINRRVKGVMEIFHRFRIDSTQEWLDFLDTLAAQACIAIEHFLLMNSLEQTNLEISQAYDNTLQGWAHALELRDHETKGHSQRVTTLTLALAEKLGLQGEELVQIRRGAFLHDVGKMGIPDKTLLNPGKLSDEEWQTMKMHPIYAFDMLHPIEFLRPALSIPRSHHEKWNGSGYPDHLKAEEIPLEARIFAVVDVWDALINKRPYKRPWSKTETLMYIREQSGIHFDPRVVAAFEEIIAPEMLN